MNITKQNTRNILVGLSITLAAVLSGCGTQNGSSSAESKLYSLEERGVTIVAPVNPQVESIDYQDVNVSFDFTLPNSAKDFDGFYLHIVKLPYGTTTLPPVDQWVDLDPHCAAIGKKADTFVEQNTSTGLYKHSLTFSHLDANTTYAFIPASYLDYDVSNQIAKRDLLASEYVIATTAVAPLPDPCLNVTGWMSQSNQTFRERWVDYTFGAHPMWCFMKDENGKAVFDGANLYREEKDPVTGTFGAPVLLQPKDGTFDSERDYMDCPLEEDHTYRYILEAYRLGADGTTKIYHDKNVTEDITMDPAKLPEMECATCE